MSIKPKISFIVPVYNVEGYLRECLDSFVRQTCRDFEVIAVNDGSTDSSPLILREYAALLPSLRIFDQSNRGLGAARNAGLDRATGEWIAFVDSDDSIDSGYCETILSQADDNCEIFEFNICSIEDGKRGVSDVTRPFSEKITLPSACNKVFRSRLWVGRRFPEGILFEDVGIIPYLICRHKVRRISDTLYFYNIRPSSIMTSVQLQRNAEITKAFDALLSQFAPGELESNRDVIDFYMIQHILVFRFNKVYSSPAEVAKNLARVLRGYCRTHVSRIVGNPYFRMLPFKQRLRVLVNTYVPLSIARIFA